MGLIEAIETSAFSEWVRSSPSIFAYTTILALHAMGLALIVGLNTLVGLRLMGYVKELPVAPLKKLFPWMYVGFTVNALSGLSLLAANLSNDLANWMFLLKLFFILLAMINLELTRMRVFEDAAALTAGTLPSSARTYGLLAIVLWGLAVVSGRLTSYPNFVQSVFGF